MDIIAVYTGSLVMISIEKSETNKKKSTGNLRQICLGPCILSWTGPMLSLWQKSGTNFMVRDKFVLDHEFCHRLVSDFDCSDRFKGFFNLSRTMKFVPHFANAKAMAKIQYKFHGPRQI